MIISCNERCNSLLPSPSHSISVSRFPPSSMPPRSKVTFQGDPLPASLTPTCISERDLLADNLTSPVKIGETCSKDSDCGNGLQCQTCPINGNTRPRCTRIRPTIPTTKVKGLPFNKYSWLTTHNSFARSGMRSSTGSMILAPTNQDSRVTSQLNNGARGIMLDLYDFENDVWLCHSFQGKCFNFTAFQPAINVLNEIRVFLEANPTEVVTIFIEDYVTSPKGLTKVFGASGLSNFLFPLSRMPKNGEDWPTVDDMVKNNQRLVVFTSKSSKEASEGIAHQWKYVVENQYGDEGMVDGRCPKRGESSPMDTKSIRLVFMNYFPTTPNSTAACAENSSPLIGMMKTCYQADGKRWPNFIAVDFYEKSDGGGAIEAVDKANGQLSCECSSIAYCKVEGNSTTCNAPAVQAPPPPATMAEARASTSSSSKSGSGSSDGHQKTSSRLSLQCLLVLITIATLLLV